MMESLLRWRCTVCKREFCTHEDSSRHMEGLAGDEMLSCPWCDGNAYPAAKEKAR